MKQALVIFLFFIVGGFARIDIPVTRKPLSISLVEDNSNLTSSPNFLAQDVSLNYNKIDHPLLNKLNKFYFGDIRVGQEQKSYTVIFDTGSNDLWLGTDKCKECPGYHPFNCENSQTCTRTQEDVEIQYGLGYVKGKRGSEVVGFTPEVNIRQDLFLIDKGKDLENYKGLDGIMGLGSKESARDFIDIAYEQGLIEEKIFTFTMDNNPSTDATELTDNSRLIIGYLPEEQVNKLLWVPVTDSNRWSTDILKIKVGGIAVENNHFMGQDKIMFDTGTSYTFLPSNAANALEKFLSPYKRRYQLFELYPCSQEMLGIYPNVTFILKGVTFNLTAWDYIDLNARGTFEDGAVYCLPAFKSVSYLYGIPPILGDAVFRKNFIAFSKRNQTMGVNINGMVPLTPIKTHIIQWIGLLGILVLIFAMCKANMKADEFHYQKALVPNPTQQNFEPVM